MWSLLNADFEQRRKKRDYGQKSENRFEISDLRGYDKYHVFGYVKNQIKISDF